MSSIEYINSVVLTIDTQPEFTNIPQNYTDLMVTMQYGLSQAADPLVFRVGNTTVDTSANYSNTILYGTGTSTGSYRDSGQVNGGGGTYYLGASTLIEHISTLYILSYSNSNIFKTFLEESGSVNKGSETGVSLWRSTNAITNIKFGAASGMARNIKSGSTFILWGIK